MWLNFLTMLQRGCGAAAALLLLLLAWSGHAAAADINFNGGAVLNCALNSQTQTYTCGSIPLASDTDRAIIASGYSVVASTSFTPAYNQSVILNGTASLQTSGSANIDLSNINPANLSTSNARFVAGGSFKLGSSITVNGSVTAASISTNSAVTITGAVSVSGLADLGSNIKIGGNLSANAVQTNSPAQIGGAIDAKTTVSLGSGTTVGGSIKGTVVTTGSPVTLNGAVTATTSFFLASGSSVTGNISSPSVTLASSSSTIKGDISTSGALDMGSGVSVTGTVNAGSAILRADNASITGNTTVSGTLELQSGTSITGTVKAATLNLRASNARINGNANISGDVLLESGTSITGDLNARNVDTKNGNAIIYGNATINSIYIDGNNRVDGCITCIGAPSSDPYRCVSKPDWYNYAPRCSGSSSTSVHHFQIKHSGTGLTCQPQSVEIKACTDASCSATATTSIKVTLTPGGGEIDVSGTTNALVRYASATDKNGVTLAASASGVTNPTICPNAATGTNNCQMVFSDDGLVLSAPDHVAKAPNILLSVQALKTSPQGTCVPLVQGATVPVKFSCGYVNPLPANANPVPVTIGGTDISCGSGGTDVNLSFNSAGLATPTLQYGEVGQTRLAAAYTTSGLGASGALQFTTAPAKIKVEPIRLNASGNFSPTAFARASETFKLRLTALNYKDEVTKNFGRESPTPQNFFIPAPALTAPANGNRPLTVGSYKSIANGVADAADGVAGQWRFDDTGTLKVTVMLDNSSGYLGNATKGFNPTTETSLVFVPDHFDVTQQAGTPMACALVGGLNNPCGSLNAAGSFVYAKQPFGLVINAYTGLKDANNNYVSPQNYVGADARPIGLSARTTADRNLAIAGGSSGVGDFNWTTAPPAAMQFSFAYDQVSKKTIGTLAAGATLPPSYDFRLTPTAPTTMYVRVTDSDGASSAGFAEPLLTVVSGRMAIPNVSGALAKPVPVAPSAQYWTGAAYAFNSQFQLASLPMATSSGSKTYYISYRKCMNGLDTSSNRSYTCPGGTTLKLATPETIKFTNGKGLFYLAPPSPALTRNGSVDITLRNPALEDASDPAADKPELLRYLPSGTGTVIFGVYRSGPVIYTREIYN